MGSNRTFIAGLVMSLATLASPAHADEADVALHRIEFQVHVARVVQNDLVRAVLAAEKENVDPARLAQDVNRTMESALAEANAQSGVQVRSGNYRTWPVHDEHRVVRWRAEQELVLESAEADTLHALIGTLQERLLVRSISYMVSPERGQETGATLTAAALQAFRARASLIVEGLDAEGYDIVRLQIGGNGAPPPMPMMMSRAMSMSEDAAVAGEPGTSRLRTDVHAVIRLRY